MSHELIRVGGQLHHVKLTMKPSQPVDGPISDGPLIRVGDPMLRVAVGMKPNSMRYLQLTFGVDPALGLSPEAVMKKIEPILELVAGFGFQWDRANSHSEPGRIAIRLIPRTIEAAERTEWLTEKLTPVLADIREVNRPEFHEVPVSKV
jgi:hypothetical protein